MSFYGSQKETRASLGHGALRAPWPVLEEDLCASSVTQVRAPPRDEDPWSQDLPRLPTAPGSTTAGVLPFRPPPPPPRSAEGSIRVDRKRPGTGHRASAGGQMTNIGKQSRLARLCFPNFYIKIFLLSSIPPLFFRCEGAGRRLNHFSAFGRRCGHSGQQPGRCFNFFHERSVFWWTRRESNP